MHFNIIIVAFICGSLFILPSAQSLHERETNGSESVGHASLEQIKSAQPHHDIVGKVTATVSSLPLVKILVLLVEEFTPHIYGVRRYLRPHAFPTPCFSWKKFATSCKNSFRQAILLIFGASVFGTVFAVVLLFSSGKTAAFAISIDDNASAVLLLSFLFSGLLLLVRAKMYRNGSAIFPLADTVLKIANHSLGHRDLRNAAYSCISEYLTLGAGWSRTIAREVVSIVQLSVGIGVSVSLMLYCVHWLEYLKLTREVRWAIPEKR